MLVLGLVVVLLPGVWNAVSTLLARIILSVRHLLPRERLVYGLDRRGLNSANIRLTGSLFCMDRLRIGGHARRCGTGRYFAMLRDSRAPDGDGVAR